MAAEVEHGQRDECVGRSESERDAGDEPDFGVHRLDAPVGQAVLDRRQDRVAVFDDPALEFDERGDPAPAGPPDPDLEGVGGLLGREPEDQPEAFLSLNRP